MAALTPEQITHIRAMSGDDCTPYDVSDEYMQYLYDTFGASEPLCMSGDPLGGTIVQVMRVRVRKASRLYNQSTETSSAAYSQKYRQINDQLTVAEAKCGYGENTFSQSTLDLGIDRDWNTSEYAPGSLWGDW